MVSKQLLASVQFIPHGHCYLWKPGLVWLHILSDALIALAYWCIPLMLMIIIRKRKDLPFDGVFMLFGAFIIACGTGHGLDIWTLWHPSYWVSGVIKAITALVSVATVVVLVRLLPQIIALPNPQQLEEVNRKLEHEISDRLAAETALRASEKRLAGILDIAQDAIVSIDKEQRIQLFNQGAEKTFGYTAAEVLGKSMNILLPISAAATHGHLVRHFSQSGSSSRKMGDRRPVSGRRQDGTEFPAEASISKLEVNEEVIYTVILQDITQRQQAENALQESKQILQWVINNIPQALFWKDRNSVYLGCNLAGAIDAGLKSPADIIGKTDYDMPWSTEQADFFRACDARVMDNNVGEVHIIEPQRQVDGKEAWLHTSKIPLHDGEGKVVGILVSYENITERRHAEEALRRSEMLHRQLAQKEELINRLVRQIRKSLDLPTILQTAVTEIRNLLQVDRCCFLWYESEKNGFQVVNEAATELPTHIGFYPTAEIGLFGETLLRKEIVRIDDSDADGTRFQPFLKNVGCQSLVALPFETSQGDIGAIACAHSSVSRSWSESEVELLQAVMSQLAIAISQADLYAHAQTAAQQAQTKTQELERTLRELTRTQAQLVQSEKMSSLGQLVAGVAHEINNPVNFIYGNITHVSNYTQDLLNLVNLYHQHYPQPIAEIQSFDEDIDLDFLEQDLPKLLSSMKAGTDRIREIVLSLRNFSRLDEAEVKSVDIHEGLNSTLLILQSRLNERAGHPKIEVIKQYGNLPEVVCSAGQLNQVFMNLICNAIDALESAFFKGITNQKPTISITTTAFDSHKVRIKIADNANGMTEDVLNHLFDPFFTTKPVGKGTGLGLSISYQIIHKHGGELKCVSTPGRGSTFTIDIPVGQIKREPVLLSSSKY